jgi:hypothetical protein
MRSRSNSMEDNLKNLKMANVQIGGFAGALKND